MAEGSRLGGILSEVTEAAGESKEALEKKLASVTLDQHKRPVVAWFITKWLIYLFIFQAGLLTLTYVLFLLTYQNEPQFQRATDGVIRGIQVILPVTTTLLGVAIGYYFREESGNNIDTTGEDII